MNESASNAHVLRSILAAQVIRNLNSTALIQKAQCMPFCKRNIILAQVTFWDKVFADITDTLINGHVDSKREWDVNQQCLEYLKKQDLVHPQFADFYFNYHKPHALSFLRKLKKQLNNGMPYHKKFEYLAVELTELLNISQIALKGLQVSCSLFDNKPKCSEQNKCQTPECVSPANIIFVMMTNEYMIEKGVFEEILSISFKYLSQAREEFIIVLDYKNLDQSDYIFGEHARNRHNTCSKVAKAVYLYNWKKGMEFSNYFEGLEPYLIPDKNGLQKVIATWKEKKEVITFS